MPNIYSKYQYDKNQVVGAEEPTINNFYEKIINNLLIYPHLII